MATVCSQFSPPPFRSPQHPPERNGADASKLQFSLQHLLYLSLLGAFLHLLPSDQIDGPGRQDQISLDGLKQKPYLSATPGADALETATFSSLRLNQSTFEVHLEPAVELVD